MSFCGTLEHNRGAGFLTLALHCIVLQDPLLAIEDARGEKNPTRKRRGDTEPVTEAGQLQMFPISTKVREEYFSLAKTMRYFLDAYQEDEVKTKPKGSVSMFARTAGLEYCDYEFYGFWYSFIRSEKEEKFEQDIEMLEKLGEGIVPKDCMPTIKFLSKLNSTALYKHNSYRGGCF